MKPTYGKVRRNVRPLLSFVLTTIFLILASKRVYWSTSNVCTIKRLLICFYIQYYIYKNVINYNGSLSLKNEKNPHLPPHCTLFGEFPEDNLLLGMLLFMLLATCLDEERVRCHPSSWLRIFSSRHIVPLQTLSVILLKIILRYLLYRVLKSKQMIYNAKRRRVK